MSADGVHFTDLERCRAE